MTIYKTKNDARIAARKQEPERESKEWTLFLRVWLAMIAGKVFGRKKKKVA